MDVDALGIILFTCSLWPVSPNLSMMVGLRFMSDRKTTRYTSHCPATLR
jgi:hypothetical protein